jgi:hypothetical protein
MKRSEKILLGAFALLFLVIIGGGIASYGVNNYRQVTAETAALKTRLQQMSTTIAQGSDWQKRSDYVDARVPKFGSHEQASSKLFKTVQDEATTAGLKISTREMIPQRIAPEGESLGYFDKASVKLTFNDAKEEDLFKWMWNIYKMKSFIGITRMALTPNGQGKSVNCEVELTQFYREAAQPKLSKN